MVPKKNPMPIRKCSHQQAVAVVAAAATTTTKTAERRQVFDGRNCIGPSQGVFWPVDDFHGSVIRFSSAQLICVAAIT